MTKIARKSFFFMVFKFGFHRANLSRSAALKLNIELSLFVSQFNYRAFSRMTFKLIHNSLVSATFLEE